MNKDKTIHDVIKERMMLPEEVKNHIKSNILFNVIMAIIMIACTLIVNITYSKFSTDIFERYIHIFQLILGIVTVIFFETAYKKDSFLISFYGIEMFIFSLGVMFVPYFYILKGNLNTLVILVILFTIYYIFKSIFTGISIRNNYIKNNISDVKEIVQDHKKGYLDEESNKTLKEKKKKQESKENSNLKADVKKSAVANKSKATNKTNSTKVKKETTTTGKTQEKNKTVTTSQVQTKNKPATTSKVQTKNKPATTSKAQSKKEITTAKKVQSNNNKTPVKKENYSNENLDEKINKLKKVQKNNKLFDKTDDKKQ